MDLYCVQIRILSNQVQFSNHVVVLPARLFAPRYVVEFGHWLLLQDRRDLVAWLFHLALAWLLECKMHIAPLSLSIHFAESPPL